jgi:hypothetical protein
VDPPQFPVRTGPIQGPFHRRPRSRRCLLKGCERLFRPRCPQARYCSPVCQRAARSWQTWQASRRYRATDPGKERRRQQSRRYRERRRQRLSADSPGVASVNHPAADDEVPLPAAAPTADPGPADVGAASPPAGASTATPRALIAGAACAGQHPTTFFDPSRYRPCQRPGCYELFLVQPRSPGQRFCSCPCRQALRRVLDREAKWRQRQRWWRRGGAAPHRPPRRRR